MSSSLTLVPSQGGSVVKRWGPIPGNFVGTWKHVAFYLRFARRYSKTSLDPVVVIAQAFLFVDGETVCCACVCPHMLHICPQMLQVSSDPGVGPPCFSSSLHVTHHLVDWVVSK